MELGNPSTLVLSYPLLGLMYSLLPRWVILPREGERLWVRAVARAPRGPLLESGGKATDRAGVVQVRMGNAPNANPHCSPSLAAVRPSSCTT